MKFPASKMTAFALAALLALIGLASCEKGDTPLEANTEDFSEFEFLLYDIELETETAMTEATLDEEISLTYEGDFVTEPVSYLENKPQFRKHKQAKILLYLVLRELNLNDEQKELVYGFWADHRKCVIEAKIKLFKSQMEIIKAANEERKLILDLLKDSVITREEAITKLIQLNIKTRKALYENPLRIETMEAIKECRIAFMANISSILDEEQLAKWNSFLEGIG